MIPPFCTNSTLIDPAGIGNRRFGEALKFATGTQNVSLRFVVPARPFERDQPPAGAGWVQARSRSGAN